MKKIFFLAVMPILIASASFAQGPKCDLIKLTMLAGGYSFDQAWSCPLKESEYFTKTFTFQSGVEYDIIAVSEDGDVLDIDMEILTPLDHIYEEDKSSNSYAEVNFTPSFDRTLIVKVKNYSSNTPNYASKVYFLIFYK